MIDRAKFYAALKAGSLYNSLRQSTVTTLDAILDAVVKYGSDGLPVTHVAYIMATAYHEVGPDLIPVRENMTYTKAVTICKTWSTRFPTLASAQPYVRQPIKLANKVYNGRMGNRAVGNDGWTYRGGGLPQTTGKDMYRKVGELVGVDLVAQPELILTPRIAVAALVVGMVDGIYTGKKLSDFAPLNYYGMRSIINADAKRVGNEIADQAQQFEKALRAANY